MVDDGAMNRKVMKRKFTTGVFEQFKWSVEVAKSGEEALEMIDENGFYDFIVMDENLYEAGGVLTGTETTMLIREKEEKCSRGVEVRSLIFGCSGNCTEEDVAISKESGQDFFWPKPVPPSELALEDFHRYWKKKS